MIAARMLLDFARGAALIGDTGYDSNEFRAEIRKRGLLPVIHSNPETAQNYLALIQLACAWLWLK